MIHPATDSPWDVHAARWHRVGCPLRPGVQDLEVFQEVLTRFARQHERVHALLLGVTAELTGLDWPANAALVAVDSSRAMLRQHWSAPRGIASFAVLGRWEQMPLQQDSIDLVCADGSLSIQANEAALAAVLGQLAHVMRDAGLVVLRTFVRPEVRESPDHVIAAMRRGEIGSFDVLKWRLLMSLHESSTEGVVLHAVHQTFREAVPDSLELAGQLDWPVAGIDTIESYRNASGRYFFPSLAQLRTLLGEHFAELNCHVPGYELGHCCPTLVLRRKATLEYQNHSSRARA